MLVELGYFYVLGFYIILDIYTAMDPRPYFIMSSNLRENPEASSISLKAFRNIKFFYLALSFAGIFTPIWGFMVLVFITFFKTNLSPTEVRTRSVVRLITYTAAALYYFN